MKFHIALLLILSGFILTYGQEADNGIKELLQKKRVENSAKSIHGYRIQIYYGLSESKAQSVRNRFIEEFPDDDVRLFYAQPEWKVHVGNYRTKLQAEKALQQIRAKFPSAFILKTDIHYP